MDKGILLESGTGELEILEFIVNNKHYAINVIKIKEVLDVNNVTKLPQTHPAITGLILCRQEIVTLLDLSYVLDGKKREFSKSKVIICEFNNLKVSFNIDNIIGVRRIKWDEIMKPDNLSESSLVTGNIIFKDRIVLLLDFEKIVTDISPSTGINEDRLIEVKYKDRSNIKIILADDSALIRKLLKDTLTKAGFKNFTIFNDGKQVLNYLCDLVDKKHKNFVEDVHLLITDIEMPQMDGHTLTRKIKEHPILKKLPVIIFSSLITGDLKHKGESLGADAQLSKPEVGCLVDLIDEYVETVKPIG